jgi:hypothetical protein
VSKAKRQQAIEHGEGGSGDVDEYKRLPGAPIGAGVTPTRSLSGHAVLIGLLGRATGNWAGRPAWPITETWSTCFDLTQGRTKAGPLPSAHLNLDDAHDPRRARR